MPEVIETTVYRFDELPEAARETARDWYRGLGLHCDWYDAVFDDFGRICDILGLCLKTRPVRLMGGSIRHDPCIWFSGFWSQGDGAMFEAWLSYGRQAARRIRDYALIDAELHRIADTLQAVQRRNFFQLRAEISHRDRYYHEYCMEITVSRDSPTWQDMTEDAEEIVIEALRDLARWLYRQLEREHDCLTSDEAVEEAILANVYTFTEDGRRFG